ncbi:MAG: hypothetical protein IRZ21_08885 [Thermoleophilaceae bacterium]|nr:hypothetical protein [Thermoleophilaceae bacterium]
MRLVLRIAAALAAFGAGVGVAELLGAADLGVAFGVGEIAFALAVAALIVLDRRPDAR